MTAFEPNRILLVLAEHGVDFIVIGGIAAVAHGSRYVTDDVDVLFEQSRSNRARLAEALVSLNARIWSGAGGPPQVATQRRRQWQAEANEAFQRIDADLLSHWKNYHFLTVFGDLDCMVTVPGAPTYEDARLRAVTIPLLDATVRIVDIDDLIAMKRAAGRPKDLLTVDELLELRKLIEEEKLQQHLAQQDRGAESGAAD